MTQRHNPYEHWTYCSECIDFEECENKEDRDGCLAGEKYDEKTSNE